MAVPVPVAAEILSKLEKRDIPWERYYDMSSQVRMRARVLRSSAWRASARKQQCWLLIIDCLYTASAFGLFQAFVQRNMGFTIWFIPKLICTGLTHAHVCAHTHALTHMYACMCRSWASSSACPSMARRCTALCTSSPSCSWPRTCSPSRAAC